MSSQPWIKFYPRDWRGDQALRLVSLPARGLWMEMLCVMHEATPYGHLTVNGQPVGDADLARLVGATVAEVQALLVELRAAGVCRQTRGGVIYSKRLIADDKRSKEGRKAKLEALENAGKKIATFKGSCKAPYHSEARGQSRGRRALQPFYPLRRREDFFGTKRNSRRLQRPLGRGVVSQLP